MIHPFNHDEHSPLAKASSLLITVDFPAWGGGHVVDDQQQFIPFATHLTRCDIDQRQASKSWGKSACLMGKSIIYNIYIYIKK